MIAPLMRKHNEPVLKRGASRSGLPAKKPARDYKAVVQGCLVILLIACVVLAYNSFLDVANTPIRGVTIQGNIQHLRKQDVETEVVSHLGSGFFLIDLSAIRSELRELPWVKDAAVRRAWPDRLIVEVEEQIPVARWGYDSLLNAEAAVFSPEFIEVIEPLPQLFGPVGSSAAVLRRYLQLSVSLAAVDLGLDLLEQDKKGSWRAQLSNGLVLVLGRRDLSNRVERFKAMYQATLRQHVPVIAQIDMRYTNGLAIEWRNNEIPSEFIRGNKA